MKKVLVLNGSPRKGGSASFSLAAAFLEGYRSAVDAEVEVVELASKRIEPCLGCYHCWKSGEGACVHEDDMGALLPAYAAADLVLLTTPVYHFGMTALLKGFFERSLPMMYPYMVKSGELYVHPERLPVNPRQAIGLFATCGFPDADNFRVLDAHAAKLFGERLGFRFYCPEGELLKVPQMRAAAAPRIAMLREAGGSFARTGRIPDGAEAAVAAPMVEVAAFARLANASWGVPGEAAPTEEQLAGREPYAPASAPAEGSSGQAGGTATEAAAFLGRMAALFNAEAAGDLDAVLQFDFSDRGESYQLRIADGGCRLEEGRPSKPSTTIIVPFATWEGISSGRIDGQEALMSGAYRVEGDFGLMMRFGSLFGPPQAPEPRKPNRMFLAFLPWYFIWFFGGNLWLGQLLPLALGAGFLGWRERRGEATWFERGTALAFACLAILALAAPESFGALRTVFANGAIAVVWGLSLLYGRPLTSDYSRNSVSSKIASSPLFRRINARLTALWALLFGASAAAGALFAAVGQGRISLYTAIALIPAGVFTAWYPKWYPGHFARRGRAA